MLTHSWTPWTMLDELHQSLFERSDAAQWAAFDVHDDEDAVTLSADVPGMSEDDLEVSVAGQILTIRGERKLKPGQYARRGRYGTFERQFRLNGAYDLDDIKANVANGELTIRIAKTASMKPRRIKLTTGVVDKMKTLLSGDKAA
jgi:HSP20 family protein